MRQKAVNLLNGTIVVNKIGEYGRLVKLCYDTNSNPCWVIDWDGSGLEVMPINVVQEFELFDGFTYISR